MSKCVFRTAKQHTGGRGGIQMLDRLTRASLRVIAAGLLCSVALYATGPGSPVADAAQAGDRAAVQKLVRAGADVNAAQGDGMTALHWAAMNGDLELTAMVLRAGATLVPRTRLGAYTPLALA